MSLLTAGLQLFREANMKHIVFAFAVILGFSAIAIAQGQSTCKEGIESIRGTYLVSYQGYLTMPDPKNPYSTPTMFPGAILGVMSIDSNGKLSGTATLAGLTSVAEYVSEGTVTLKADCTGVMKFSSTNKETNYSDSEVDKFIALINGNDVEIHAIMANVSQGIVPVVLGKWKRIAYKANAAVW
jgi:hypothetical protein